MVAYGGEVGGCGEEKWGWAGGQGSMLFGGGSSVSTGFLCVGGAIRKEKSWFLVKGKKKDCLSSLWHHSTRGPGLAIQSLISWDCASTPNSRNIGKVLISL